MNEKLTTYIKSLDITNISEERKSVLAPLIEYIRSKQELRETALLNFVCTHNSRRSQLSQIWAQIAAYHYNIAALCFSGGTEVTAFNERAVAAIERTGIHVTKRGDDSNPTYLLQYAETAPAITTFSKTYADTFNPTKDFAAIMTCSDADKNCPFIPGAKRIKVTYIDPKVADNTPQETVTYDERTRQIATEMFYVMANV